MQRNTNVPIYMPRIGRPKYVRPSLGPIRWFKYFIEKTDWDKDLLRYEKWTDLLCWTVIAVSVLFFIPVSLSVVWR